MLTPTAPVVSHAKYTHNTVQRYDMVMICYCCVLQGTAGNDGPPGPPGERVSP